MSQIKDGIKVYGHSNEEIKKSICWRKRLSTIYVHGKIFVSCHVKIAPNDPCRRYSILLLFDFLSQHLVNTTYLFFVLIMLQIWTYYKIEINAFLKDDFFFWGIFHWISWQPISVKYKLYTPSCFIK